MDEKVLEQMEFYLSDSNLRRDRYLRQKIEEAAVAENGEFGLELDLFLNFNKIKTLVSTELALKDILLRSTSLRVWMCESEQKWFVARRDWPADLSEFLGSLDNNQDFDRRTIYCENLPISANQEWLRKVFSQFGKINLVSVPTFKGHKRIKQFSFVEFADLASMEKVLDYFRRFNGVLYEDTQPDNLQSIRKFHEEEEGVVDDSNIGSSDNVAVGGGKQNKTKKKNKNNKRDAHTVGNIPLKAKGIVEDKEVMGNTSVPQIDPKDSPLNDNMIYDMKIMTKIEWKRLRNKYLNLQREMVREMKKQAYYRRCQYGQQMSSQQPASQVQQGNPRKRPCPESAVEGEEDAPSATLESTGKRRKRGREKIKQAIKKSSHIFFDAE